jgi:hypothetical protein
MVSLVTAWTDGPLFVHVTVVPAFTVSVDGLNEKSWIVT